jgi:hypothetical protein
MHGKRRKYFSTVILIMPPPKATPNTNCPSGLDGEKMPELGVVISAHLIG